jgi:hypothetical protein
MCLLWLVYSGVSEQQKVGRGEGKKEAQSQVVEANQKRRGLLTCNEFEAIPESAATAAGRPEEVCWLKLKLKV